MGLLLDAARAWDEICKTSYRLELGHKGRQVSIDLVFMPGDLPHLAGMQYAKDVDFGLRPAEYYGVNLIEALLSGKMDELRILSARAWPRIEGRLKAIIRLQQTLSKSFIITQFNPKKVQNSCNIEAEYVIKNTDSGETFFVFLDEDNSRYYCKSAFQSEFTDYTRFQTPMTVLQIIKRSPMGEELLYRHPNYRERSVT